MCPDPLLSELNAEAWCGFGVSGESSTVIATAKECGRPSFLFLQSNADVAPEFARRDDFRNEYGELSAVSRFTLQNATVIVCQTRRQQELLKEHFGRDSAYVPPPIDLAIWKPTSASRQHVLWIGRSDRFHKRPHLCLEAARRLPQTPFLMVMNRTDPLVNEEIRRQAPPNVSFRPYVPHDEMPALFAAAAAFVGTGAAEFEGFPNVYLQAAACGTPIVAMHDFDGFLAQSGAGVACGEEVALLAEKVQAAVEDPRSISASFDDVRAFLAKKHDLAVCCRQVRQLVAEAIK